MSGAGLPPVSFAEGLARERQAKGDARFPSHSLTIRCTKLKKCLHLNDGNDKIRTRKAERIL